MMAVGFQRETAPFPTAATLPEVPPVKFRKLGSRFSTYHGKRDGSVVRELGIEASSIGEIHARSVVRSSASRLPRGSAEALRKATCGTGKM